MSALINNLIYEAIQQHRRATRSSNVSLPELMKNHSRAFDLAEEAATSNDTGLRDAGEKLLMALTQMGLSAGTGTPIGEGNTPPVTATVAPSPAAPVRSFEREWSKLEDAAVEVAGPLASKAIKQLKSAHPGVEPSTLSSVLNDALSPEIGAQVLREYRSRK